MTRYRLPPNAGRGLCVVSALVFGAVLSSCVTEIIDADRSDVRSVMPASEAVVVPLWPDGQQPATGQELARDAFYSSILNQMTEAVVARDVLRLSELLQQHDDPRAPGWVRDHFERLRDVSAALEFVLYAQQAAVLRSKKVDSESRLHVLGKDEGVVFSLPAGQHPAVSLDARGDHAIALLASFRVTDHDVFGNRLERSVQSILRPEQSLQLEAGAVFSIDVPFPQMPTQGIWREVEVQVSLLPTELRIGGRTAPVRQTPLADTAVRLYPPGAEVVRAKPLKTLEAALGRSDRSAVLRHIALAAHFMPSESGNEAIDRVIAWLRLARPVESRIAMAALREMSGQPFSIDDRAAWLSWSRAR